MKFLVNNIGILPASTRGNALRKISKPQYLRSGDALEENSDSEAELEISKDFPSVINHTVNYYTEKFLKRPFRRRRGVGPWKEVVQNKIPNKMNLWPP